MGWSRWLGCLAMLAAANGPAQTDPLAPLPAAQPVPPPPLYSSAALPGFEGYKQRLVERARREGVSESTIMAIIPGLTLNGRVIDLDRGQPGQPNNPNAAPPFAPYRRAHVTQDLINRGRAVYYDVYSQMAVISARTGVEPGVMISIFGHETSYGRVTGGFDLPQALASLAYEGRRRSLFEGEFIAALKLVDRGTPRWRLKGSWAGATGFPQFMPSTILRLATDGDGDGRASIWSSRADGLASIGTYLRDAGWKRGVHWGIPVAVPASLNRAALASHSVAPRCPQVYARHSQWRSWREWRAMGVQALGSTAGIADDEQLSLLEPDGRGATAYLLSHNYRVILDYNCSNFYALSVGLLADAIERR